MIPRRITLEGFLCYREERTIDLDGADLWVFTGRNGSGKSAVFDAITFALFNAHRGGKQDAASLINRDCSSLRVVFEFDLGPERYRIQRGVRRNGRSDRQLFRFAPSEGRADQWPPVPETHDEEAFKGWVKDAIGMNFEAFTASVLLRQGEADRLISAKDRERFEILSGIVDLARYKRLADAADSRRKVAEGLAKDLAGRLDGLPPIAPEAVAAARDRASRAEEARARADAERERLLVVEREARAWSGLATKRVAERARLERAEALLADGVAIGRDASRLRELTLVLPTLAEQVERAEQILAARAEVGRLARKEAVLARKQGEIAALSEEAEGRRRAMVEELAAADGRRAEILLGRASLVLPMDRAQRAAALALAILEWEGKLSTYPSDIAERVTECDARHRQALRAEVALPWLEALAVHRAGLDRSRTELGAASAEIAGREIERRRLLDDRESQSGRLAEARRAELAARDRSAREAALVTGPRDRLASLLKLDGRADCDRCGQPLTPGHVAEESRRLGDAIDSAEARCRDAEEALRQAERHRAEVQRVADELGAAIDREDDRLRVARQRQAQAKYEVANHNSSCLRDYRSLDGPVRSLVAAHPPDDWASTTFPTPEDLEGFRNDAGLVEDLQNTLREAQASLKDRQSCRDELDRARREHDSVGVEPVDESAASRDAAMAGELEALDRSIEGLRTRRDLAVEDAEGVRKKADDLGNGLSEVKTALAVMQARIETLTEAVAKARSGLPESWWGSFDEICATKFEDWATERSALAKSGVEERVAALREARGDLEAARAAVDELDALIARIPEKSRLDPERVVVEIAEAKIRLDAASKDANDLGAEADGLAREAEDRRALADRALDAKGRAAVAATLAGLLGWEGLQRQLLREAERAIVAESNPILGAISGGEMQLRLCAEGDDERALQLEAIVRTHGSLQAIKAPYLSGSQRFRVAVSLALAIGRCMRHGRDRPIESVVIDEGFGSLDARGRREMIAQLRELKGYVARIILVSHEQEFADAFDDGYRFEVIDRTTVVERLHR